MNKMNIKVVAVVLLNELYENSNNEHIKVNQLAKKYHLDERQERTLRNFRGYFKKYLENNGI